MTLPLILALETGTEIREISLLEHNPEMDKIIWRWTSDEEYTTNSAYHIQVIGQATRPSITSFWKILTNNLE